MFGKKDTTDFYGLNSKRKGAEDVPETGYRHSTYYHKHFSGYTEVRNENAKGRYNFKRIYTAPWHVAQVSDGAWVGMKVASIVLILTAAAFHMLAIIIAPEAANCWYVILPVVLAMLASVVLIYVCILFVLMKRKSTAGDFQSYAGKINIIGIIGWSLFILSDAGRIAYLIINKAGTSCLALELGGTICIVGLWIIHKLVRWRTVPNDAAIPTGEKHAIY